MALVSVAGACSRSGKTALACSLLAAVPPGQALAVKFTSTEDVFERCPRGAPCAVCDIDVPYRLVRDEQVLQEPGTDTARLLLAGAREVLWCIARQGALVPAWRAVSGACAGAGLVVMEGSTIVTLARPELLLFVAHPWLAPARWKAGSDELARRADVVVVNRPRSETRPPASEVLERLHGARGRDDLRVADVTLPLEAWAPELSARLLAAVTEPNLQGALTSR